MPVYMNERLVDLDLGISVLAEDLPWSTRGNQT